MPFFSLVLGPEFVLALPTRRAAGAVFRVALATVNEPALRCWLRTQWFTDARFPNVVVLPGAPWKLIAGQHLHALPFFAFGAQHELGLLQRVVTVRIEANEAQHEPHDQAGKPTIASAGGKR